MKSQTNLLELNRDCDCFPIERDNIDKTVLSLSGHPQMAELLAERRNYFASTPVFVAPEMAENMQQQIIEIEQFMGQSDYQNKVFERSALAAFAPAKFTRGAFMGYDFHITEEGPRLIEINSNAGGAFIVNAIQKAIGLPFKAFEEHVVEMFKDEWRLSGNRGALSSVAIVDEKPESQFHYPDMILAASVLRRYGLKAEIVDPQELEYRNAGVYVGDKKMDLIYNRLTDFDLSLPEHQILRQAWLDKAVTLTPDPRHHTLYADKRNLCLLTDRQKRLEFGAKPWQDKLLSQIPETVEVSADNADYLWAQRRKYFFKPFTGFGSRAVYRGAKLTKKTWAHILQGGYVAQRLVQPPSRLISVSEPPKQLKYDVRVYSYNGKALSMAARVYQGQVTNLRTEGGGLAPVITMTNPTCHK